MNLLKPTRSLARFLALIISFTAYASVQAEDIVSLPAPPDHESIAKLGLHGNAVTAGAEISDMLATSTGMAVSPLIGVSALGAYTYIKADDGTRANLPWWAHPYFWGGGLALVAFSFLRDSIGAALPSIIRKPLQILDSIEDKISALVAGVAVTPSLFYLGEAMFIQQGWLDQNPTEESTVMMAGLAMDQDSITRSLLAGSSMAAFGIVWLVAHAFNILVVLSPFREVDVVLKSLKAGFLTVYVSACYFIPGARIVLPILLILTCIPFVGWAYRLNVFGSLLGWDFIRKILRKDKKVTGQPLRAFSHRGLKEIPTRCYGKLRVDEASGDATFTYRRLPILPKRELCIPGSQWDTAIQQGLIVPGLTARHVDEEDYHRLFDFRLAFRGEEEALAKVLHQNEIRPWALARGLRAAWGWMKNTGAKSRATAIALADRIEDRFDGEEDEAAA